MATHPTPAQIQGSFTLRSPRVVVLFPESGNWKYWAMRAIELSQDFWGAVDWIYIPFTKDGSVDPALVEVVRRYDPDHVVLPKFKLEDLRTGDHELWLKLVEGFDASVRSQSASQALLENDWTPMGSARARDLVHDASSAFEHPATERHPARAALRSIGDETRLLKVEELSLSRSGLEACADRSWSSIEALLFAASAGIARGQAGQPRPQPSAIDLTLNAFNDGTERDFPGTLIELRGVGALGDTHRARAQIDASAESLIEVVRNQGQDHLVLVEVTDSQSWALAVALQKIHGDTLGFSTDTIAALAGDDGSFERLVDHVEASFPIGIDAILTYSGVGDVSDGLRELASKLASYLQGREEPAQIPVCPLEPGALGKYRRLRIMREHRDTRVVVAASRQADGTLVADTELRPPIPTRMIVGEHDLVSPYWIVDFSPRITKWPAHPRVDTHAFIVAQHQYSTVVARPSEAGLSFLARRQGFLSSRSFIESRVSTPRLQVPSLQCWATLRAEKAGYSARLSDAGLRHQFLRERLGSDKALEDILQDSGWRALHAFTKLKQRSTTQNVFPEGEGIILHGTEPFLTVAAIESVCGPQAATEIMETLLNHELLRVGLVLRCTLCKELDFYPLEQVASRFNCHRCLSHNTVNRTAWGPKLSEPKLYFDLHKVARDFMDSNSDVLIRLAIQERLASRSLEVAAELEILKPSGGARLVELDGLLLIDEELAVVECKSTPSLGNGTSRSREISKKAQAVEILGARKFALACGHGEWGDSVLDVVRGEFRKRGLEHIEVVGLGNLRPQS